MVKFRKEVYPGLLFDLKVNKRVQIKESQDSTEAHWKRDVG